MEIQKFEYLETGKSVLDVIKSIFHNFLRAAIWQKKKEKEKKNSEHKLSEFQNKFGKLIGKHNYLVK